MDPIKIKSICYLKDSVMRTKQKTQTGRKYLQISYLIRDLNPECIKKLLKFNKEKISQEKEEEKKCEHTLYQIYTDGM